MNVNSFQDREQVIPGQAFPSISSFFKSLKIKEDLHSGASPIYKIMDLEYHS